MKILGKIGLAIFSVLITALVFEIGMQIVLDPLDLLFEISDRSRLRGARRLGFQKQGDSRISGRRYAGRLHDVRRGRRNGAGSEKLAEPIWGAERAFRL